MSTAVFALGLTAIAGTLLFAPPVVAWWRARREARHLREQTVVCLNCERARRERERRQAS